MEATVEAVHRGAVHQLSKLAHPSIRLLEGLGVEGDVHAGSTVRHRSRLRRRATTPNLRQVHLISGELHDELRGSGYEVGPGQLGENVTTRGIDLLALPAGSRLRLGDDAVVAVTGLRTPCRQLEGLHAGLMAALVDRDAAGRLVRKAGVMAVVVRGGQVGPGDVITVELPPTPHRPLPPV